MVGDGTARRRHTIAAFAIEDRVDFRFLDCPESGVAEAINSRPALPDGVDFVATDIDTADARRDFFFSGALIPGAGYHETVYRLMDRALSLLHAKYKKPDGSSPLSDIECISVSTAGVVRRSSILVQLPLWSWPTQAEISWNGPDGTRREHFSFADVIEEICTGILGAELAQELPTDVNDNFIAVNDTVAAAAATVCLPGFDDKAARVALVRAHNGINSAFIADRRFSLEASHPEAGHIYPVLHNVDITNEFGGTCPFHGSCLEGMVSQQSIVERALPTGKGIRPIAEWNKLYLELQKSNVTNPKEALFDAVIGNDTKAGHPLGIEIAAHYVGQLVHQLLLSAMVPDRVLLTGRFCTAAVIDRIKSNLGRYFSGYPLTDNLRADQIDSVVSAVPVRDRKYMDLTGATVIAYARSLILDNKEEYKFVRNKSFLNLFDKSIFLEL